MWRSWRAKYPQLFSIKGVLAAVAAAWQAIEFLLDSFGAVDQVRSMMAEDYWFTKLLFWPDLGISVTVSGFALLLFLFWLDRHRSPGDALSVEPPPDWRSHESRFAKLNGSIYALWTYYTEDGSVSWNIVTNQGSSARDRQAFEAEATAAATDLAKIQLPSHGFTPTQDASAVERWLNALHVLVDPKSDFEMTGVSEGKRTVGGTIEDLVEASKVACARLATGDISPPGRAARKVDQLAARKVGHLRAVYSTFFSS